jgi:hypothetical protein
MSSRAQERELGPLTVTPAQQKLFAEYLSLLAGFESSTAREVASTAMATQLAAYLGDRAEYRSLSQQHLQLVNRLPEEEFQRVVEFGAEHTALPRAEVQRRLIGEVD